jgi:hypothetical protein
MQRCCTDNTWTTTHCARILYVYQGGQHKPRRPSTAPATTTATTATAAAAATTALVAVHNGADAAASRVVQRTPGEEFSLKLTDRSKAVISKHGRMKLTYRCTLKPLQRMKLYCTTTNQQSQCQSLLVQRHTLCFTECAQ